MRMSIFIILVSLYLQPSYAGVNGITHHSRANCVNNESISWDWNNNWWFLVKSDHIDEDSEAVIHTLTTGWQNTWRAAAVHWGEGNGGWLVHGEHWMRGRNGKPVLVWSETVADCSIYDGWWDRNK